MSIFIVGRQGVGKSTVARMLASELNCRAAETGQVVTDELARLYARFVSGNREHAGFWSRALSALKDDVRDQLEVLGELMTRMKGDCLVNQCRMQAVIIVGVRRRREVCSLPHSNADRWIRVERSGVHSQGVFELDDMPCEFVLRNNGSLQDLKDTVKDIAVAIQ